MSIVDGVRKLPTPLLAMIIGSKLIVGIGIGILLAGFLTGWGWPLVVIGVILSIIPLIRALGLK
jgi:hypothetical protein